MLGGGFGRTGTMSLKVALEELGFGPCYHMIEVFRHPKHAALWEAAWRGELVDWSTVLGDYKAAVDWPACTFYRELMERSPEAKVILSVRDPERWYESMRNTIYEIRRIALGSPLSRASFALAGLFIPGVYRVGRMIEEIIWRGTFDGRFEDRRHAIEVFRRHNKEVEYSVPEERLLVYEIREGWKPLCEFLGVEEPDKPFPHTNDTAEMRRAIRVIRVFSLTAPVALALLTFLLLRNRVAA